MHIPATALARGHGATLLYLQGHVLKLKSAAEEDIRKAREVVFSVRGVPPESVSNFLYLGRQLSSTDDDWPDVVKNLAKARKRWATISRVLIRDGATPRISAMFYTANVQSVLRYGSETWVLSPKLLSKLEGFHTHIARRLTGRTPVYNRREYEWQYLPLGNALEEASLFPIDEYITRRRNKIAEFVATRPLHDICCKLNLIGLGDHNQFWWDQL
jgi:hypothetical protein